MMYCVRKEISDVKLVMRDFKDVMITGIKKETNRVNNVNWVNDVNFVAPWKSELKKNVWLLFTSKSRLECTIISVIVNEVSFI